MHKLILFLIFIILTISNCRIIEGDKNYDLPLMYKTSLKEGDTLIYINQYNNYDTLIVSGIINGFREKSSTGTWGKPPFNIFQFQNVYLNHPKDTLSSNLKIRINKEDGLYYDDFNNPITNVKECICIVSGLNDLLPDDGIDYNPKISWYDSFSIDLSFFNRFYEEQIIRGKTYYNVYKFPSIVSYIKTFYFSFEVGFIRIDKQNGEIWELLKII